MRMRTSRSISMLVALFAFLSPRLEAAPAPADPAAGQIQVFYDALVETMKRGKELGVEGRYKELVPVVQATFDLPGMTRLSVGPIWNMLSELDRQAIVDAFTRMTVANYAKNFASFGGEQFTIDPMVKMRNEDKIVESKLIGSDKAATPFNYRLHMVGDTWKILDVYLNGYVSQLALRRADFSSTVSREGAAALVKKINDLADRQMADAS
jgi:phospholipid transport system substrate-binding protein